MRFKAKPPRGSGASVESFHCLTTLYLSRRTVCERLFRTVPNVARIEALDWS